VTTSDLTKNMIEKAKALGKSEHLHRRLLGEHLYRDALSLLAIEESLATTSEADVVYEYLLGGKTMD
jgi:hypothetical protein